jgi:folate-dependent tRNA-U54 methylase TrmFO/GidA
VLRAARLVDAEKKGLYVEYRLADDEVCRFFVALRGLAEARLAEVEQVTRAYFDQRGAMEAVARRGAAAPCHGAARSRCSTFARPRSSAPGTSPAPCRSRWTSSRPA